MIQICLCRRLLANEVQTPTCPLITIICQSASQQSIKRVISVKIYRSPIIMYVKYISTVKDLKELKENWIHNIWFNSSISARISLIVSTKLLDIWPLHESAAFWSMSYLIRIRPFIYEQNITGNYLKLAFLEAKKIINTWTRKIYSKQFNNRLIAKLSQAVCWWRICTEVATMYSFQFQ